jgi:hypothetical protein
MFRQQHLDQLGRLVPHGRKILQSHEDSVILDLRFRAHDFLQGCNVSVERLSAVFGQSNLNSTSSLDDRTFDGDVARLLEGRELFGQGGVRNIELVSHEREINPVSGREQSDNRKSGTGVYEFIE